MQPVLILTHSRDSFTVPRVVDALAELGAEAIRLDTGRFPMSVRISSGFGLAPEEIFFETEEVRLCARDVSAVWSRRIWEPTLDPELDARFRELCRAEAAEALAGFFEALGGARWVNRPREDRLASHKPRQLRLAGELGLRVPRTLLTNDPDHARRFFGELGGAVVCKLQRAPSVSMEAAPLRMHTSVVRTEDLGELDALRHAPMLFQENVPKALELRAVVVGDELFVGAIDASASATGATHWRAAASNEVAWTKGSVSGQTAERLRELARRLGLVFGAIDLIRTPSGEEVFLEINPVGEWGMLERDLDLPISEAIARSLVSTPGGPS